jgi:transmembrane sensor
MKTSQPGTPEQYLAEREAIEFQAAEWSDTLREAGDEPGVRAAFEQWRAESPLHAQAFERIDAAYRTALAAGGSREMVELENEMMALGAARAHRRSHRRGASIAMAAGLMAVVAAGFYLTGGSLQELQHLQQRAAHALAGETLYRTGVGERLAVVLTDGSTLTLNTDSRAVVRYRDQIRGVTLVNGQALFEVAKDPAHPFVVTAGGRKVTALGTAFDVRVSEQRLQVTLLEGRVTVEPSVAASGPSAGTPLRTELAPGEQFVTGATGETVIAEERSAPEIRKADIKRTVSWRDGQVIFENDLLVEAVAEINRYGGRRVVLANDALGNLRVSGIFNTGNTAVFVETLTNFFPLRVVESDAERIVVAAREG